MVRGALQLFEAHDVVIVDPSDEGCWVDALGIGGAENGRIRRGAGPIHDFGPKLQPGDVLFFLGADVIDGTCGIEPSLDRLDLIADAALHGHPVYVSCSFRSRVDPPILERLRLMPQARFLLRDAHSLQNFERQTGLSGRLFPDISFFCPPQDGPATQETVAAITAARQGRPVLGLNFAEHSFRSFFDDHSEANRDRFVDAILRQLTDAHPDALFVLFSNDDRNWENHPSDVQYQDRATRWIEANLGPGRCLRPDVAIGYGGNIVGLRAVDLLVTGRMHLSLAAFRAGTVPLVVMGQSAGYTSVDKMRGVFERHLGTTDAVITDIGKLGAASRRFLAQRDLLKDRMADIILQQTSSNEQNVERLMTDIGAGSAGEPADEAKLGPALAAALSIVTRGSDERARERARADELHGRIEALLTDRAEEQRQLGEAAVRLAALGETMEARGRPLGEAAARIAALGEAMEARERQLGEAAARLAALGEALEARERPLGEAAGRLATLGETLEARERPLGEAATRLAALGETLAARERQIAELSEALWKREQQITDRDDSRYRSSQNEIEALQRELAELKKSSDTALWEAEYRTSAMAATGDRLVRELCRAHSQPLRPLSKGLQRAALRFVLLFARLMPERTADGLRRSLFKRKPARFLREWDQACGRPVDALPPRPERVKVTFDRRLYLIAMRLLAALISPVAALTAARLRRSADKRDPKKIAAARRALAAQTLLTPEATPGLIEPKAPVTVGDRARRILVADYRIPRPDVSAGEQATFGLIADLCATGFEVVFCSTDMTDIAPYRENLEALGCTVISRESGHRSAGDYIRDAGHSFGSFYLIRFDVAEAILPRAREVAPDAIVIFHAPDLYFLREGRAAELSRDAAHLAAAEETRRRELAMMNACDHVVLVSPAEIPVLAAYIPRDKISVFPALYSPVRQDPPGFAERSHLFFLGGFKHTPNVAAVKWFVRRVWPRIHAALPEAEFHIVGAEASDEVLTLAEVPGVRHIGYVADLEPVLASYRLSVAPLLYGAGIKGKIGASLGAGVPSVCTTIAAEGMGIIDGLHALVRDEPQAFADAVIGLYCDEALWQRISENGRTLVRENFGDSANRSSFLRALDRAGVLPVGLYVEHCQKAAPAAFPALDPSATVDVSIIVPVYNKWALTQACLNSLLIAGRATGLRYEVILADDGSSDETLEAGALYPNLKVVREGGNRGFLVNSKTAAARASGRHLLFLNNDTVVLPGWLEPLVRALDEDPRIAIAGSKLLYPDSSIQETGAVLFSDATAGNIGRGHPRQIRLYSLGREVDYATGASMLVRGAFWREIGGFDERYVPGYCEDSDLAMTARDHGYRVVCVPDSQVVHFEHGTYAAESASRPKDLATANGAKFLAKWAKTFETRHMPPGTPVDIAAAHAERQPPIAALERRRAGKLNVLYFSPFPSHPDNHGNQATIQAFGRHFRDLGHKVHFALLQSHMYDAAALAQMQAAWDSLDILPNQCSLGSNGRPIPFDGWYEEGLGQRIRVLCDAYDIDVVFCSYVFQSRLLDYVPAHILKVVDTHDKMGDRYEMLRKNGQPLEFFSCSPEEEGAYLRRGDIVVARRAEEAAYFNSVTGRDSAIVIPHVEEPRFLDRRFGKLTDVGMVASANRINLAIALQLLQAIDARVADTGCPFTLHIAGQVRDMIHTLPEADAALFARPWVKLHGFVTDIGAFYGSLDLVVSPVTMGTGINVKTVQAMAYGMPLVTTRWGGKGIETGHRLHDHADLDALVSTLIALAADPSPLEELAEVSRRHYEAFYGDSIRAMAAMFSAVKI